MHCHGLRRKQRIAVHLALHKFRAADHRVDVLVSSFQFPELRFHRADNGLRSRAVDALAFGAVHKVTAEALLTVLMGHRIVQHMVRTDELVVMRRENDLALMPSLFPPFDDLQDDRRSQLVVEVVQMADIRLEIIQHKPQFLPSLTAVNRLDWVGQLAQLASTVEIHIRCISIDPVAHAAAFVLHSEVLNLVSVLLQCLTQFKYVRL